MLHLRVGCRRGAFHGPGVYPAAAIGEPEEHGESRGAVREAVVHDFFGESDLFSGFDKFACAFAGEGRGA